MDFCLNKLSLSISNTNRHGRHGCSFHRTKVLQYMKV
jgi:hypothetical protein